MVKGVVCVHQFKGETNRQPILSIFDTLNTKIGYPAKFLQKLPRAVVVRYCEEARPTTGEKRDAQVARKQDLDKTKTLVFDVMEVEGKQINQEKSREFLLSFVKKIQDS